MISLDKVRKSRQQWRLWTPTTDVPTICLHPLIIHYDFCPIWVGKAGYSLGTCPEVLEYSE